MNSIERIEAALHFQEVDRVPAALFDGGMWLMNEKGMSFADLLAMENGGAQVLIDLYEEIDPDLAFAGNGTLCIFHGAMGAKIVLDEIGGPAHSFPMLKEADDAFVLDQSTIRERLLADKNVQAVLQQIRTIKDYYKGKKYVIAGCAAPFSLAALMLGMQKMMEAISDEEEGLAPLLQFATALSIETSKLIIEAGADILCIGDPVASGAIISATMYEEYAFPAEKALFEAVGDSAYKLLHICGNTKPRLEMLKQLPIDIFSLDSVDISEAMAIADKNYVIFGNLSTTAILKDKTAAEVSAIAQQVCNQAGKQGGFILSAGCDLAPGTPLDNLKALLNAPKMI